MIKTKISNLIKQLQEIKDEHGDLITTYARPDGSIYVFDEFDLHVCIDGSELVYDNIGGVTPLREYIIDKAVVFGSR